MPAAVNTTPLKIPSVMKWQVWNLVSWSTRILGHNILQFCRHCTTLGSNGFWGQAALSSELFVCCTVRTISAVKTLRITGGRRNAVSNWVCRMKGQFVYTVMLLFPSRNQDLKELESCTLLTERFLDRICTAETILSWCLDIRVWEARKQVWVSFSSMSHSLICFLHFR